MRFDVWQRLRRPSPGLGTARPYIGQLARPLPPVTAGDALEKALHLFRSQQVPALPIVDGPYLAGWVTEQSMSSVVADYAGNIGGLTVNDAREPAPLALDPGTPADEAVVAFHALGATVLPVATRDGRYLGLVARADVLAAAAGQLRPARVGGMATPLGVYLTNGAVSGGVKDGGMVLAGMVLGLIMWIAQAGLTIVTALLARFTGLQAIGDLARLLAEERISGPPPYVTMMLVLSIALLLTAFLALVRVLPRLAGYHGAEHKTVNAMEAGEPLTPEAVRLMSRVHPRCGTNLWGVLVIAYIGFASASLVLSTEVGRKNASLVALLAIMALALAVFAGKRIGSWIQSYFTTREPTAAELASALRAGKELLRRYQADPRASPGVALRIWRMGFIQVLAGLMLMGALLQLLAGPLDAAWRYLLQ